MPKLNQILAVEKGVKTKTNDRMTVIHRETSTKPALMNGFSKTFRPVDEEGENFPPESQAVQVTYKAALDDAKEHLSELFDITATKDWANTQAKGNIEVDGEVLMADVPATYLLFLEKQLADIRTLVRKITELDSAVEWKFDEVKGVHRSEPVETHRPKKIQKAIVLFPATPEHPAQTQLISEDVVVGYWTTIKSSGAIPAPQKKKLIDKIDKLTKAVKFAREAANSQPAEHVDAGEKILGYLFE